MVARVAPTKSFLALRSSNASKSTSLEAIDRFEQHVAIAVLGAAEQIVFAGKAAHAVRPQLIERCEHRAFASAKRQHDDVLLAKAERQRLRDRTLGRVDTGVGGVRFVVGR